MDTKTLIPGGAKVGWSGAGVETLGWGWYRRPDGLVCRAPAHDQAFKYYTVTKGFAFLGPDSDPRPKDKPKPSAAAPNPRRRVKGDSPSEPTGQS